MPAFSFSSARPDLANTYPTVTQHPFANLWRENNGEGERKLEVLIDRYAAKHRRNLVNWLNGEMEDSDSDTHGRCASSDESDDNTSSTSTSSTSSSTSSNLVSTCETTTVGAATSQTCHPGHADFSAYCVDKTGSWASLDDSIITTATASDVSTALTSADDSDRFSVSDVESIDATASDVSIAPTSADDSVHFSASDVESIDGDGEDMQATEDSEVESICVSLVKVEPTPISCCMPAVTALAADEAKTSTILSAFEAPTVPAPLAPFEAPASAAQSQQLPSLRTPEIAPAPGAAKDEKVL